MAPYELASAEFLYYVNSFKAFDNIRVGCQPVNQIAPF